MFLSTLVQKTPEKYKFEKSPVTSVTGIHDFYITSGFPVTKSDFSCDEKREGAWLLY